jgi:hypothetical protein
MDVMDLEIQVNLGTGLTISIPSALSNNFSYLVPGNYSITLSY